MRLLDIEANEMCMSRGTQRSQAGNGYAISSWRKEKVTKIIIPPKTVPPEVCAA